MNWTKPTEKADLDIQGPSRRGAAMVLGKLKDSDVGHWLRADDGQVVRLLRIQGPLLLVQTKEGNVYWPVHDIKGKISDDEAMQLTGGTVKETPVKRKRITQPYKRVVRTDADGKEVVFASIKEAAERSGVSCGSISLACYGKKKKKTTGGYIFRFENPELILKPENYD